MQGDLWTGPHQIPETQLISADLWFKRSLPLNHPESKIVANLFFTNQFNFSITNHNILLKSDVIPTLPLCLKSLNTDAIFLGTFSRLFESVFPHITI